MQRNEHRPLAAATRTSVQGLDHLAALRAFDPEACALVDGLLEQAVTALSKMYLGDGTFLVASQPREAGTICLMPELPDGPRTAAIVALGLSRLPVAMQRRALHGMTATELSRLAARHALRVRDIDTVAIAAWAMAEAAQEFPSALFARLTRAVTSCQSAGTAVAARSLLAALAAGERRETEALIAAARERLLAGQCASGLFPAMLPGADRASPRQPGTLADQAFAIAALSRLAAERRSGAALYAASAAAARLCALQGLAGQWWWGYAPITGRTNLPYPLVTPHQHALAPMALLSLIEAGGPAHWPAIARGLNWIERHPETGKTPIRQRAPFVWRQVSRPDAPPAKAQLTRECRAEDFAWMLFAWKSAAQRVRTKDGGRSHGHHHAG